MSGVNPVSLFQFSERLFVLYYLPVLQLMFYIRFVTIQSPHNSKIKYQHRSMKLIRYH
jgi:hypothetical protein